VEAEALNVSWSAIPSVLFLVLSALALLAGAVAVVRASYVKAQIEGLRGDRDDLQSRLTEARTESAECKAHVAEMRSRLEVEVQKREALEQIVTGKKELEAVLEILRSNNAFLNKVDTKLDQLLKRRPPQ
jgi:chromosome segregation ATPase